MAETKYRVVRDEERRVLTRGSLEIFARFYFPHILTCEPAPFHIQEYNRFCPGRDVPRPLRLMVIWPRDHGKSQIKSVIKNLWEVCCDPYGLGYKNIDKMLVSNTMTLTEKWMRVIEGELAGNALLIADWGNLLRGAKVNNVGEKVLGNGARLYARAYGSQVRGEHPSGVDVDDLEDRIDAQNPDLRKKMYEFFTQDLYGTLSPEAAFDLWGTIVHEESLLHTLWKDRSEMTSDWTKVKYSAIQDDGTALWPARWSLERLEKRRQEVKDLAFSQEYLNMPIASENPSIRPEWIQYVDTTPERFDLQCITACDPAFSEKVDSDYTAVITIGIVSDGKDRGKIYVVDRERGHWSPSDACRTVIAQTVRWKSDVVVMEGVAGAIAMIDLLANMKRQRNVNFTTKLVKPTRLMDKVSRSQSVANLFESGRVFFKKTQRDIVEELLLLPNGEHDDMADALVWALREAKNGLLKQWSRVRTTARVADYVDEMAGY